MLEAILYTDPGCPWAYSANPALRVLEWRYRDQLAWRLVMVGLREHPSEAAVGSFDAQRSLARWRVFEQRYGMPFGSIPKERPSGTGRGCRAVVAAALVDPGSEWTVFRALQRAYFTTSLLLDDAESIRIALAEVPSIDGDRIADRVDDAEVVAEYERQLVEVRSAAGTPAEAQGKAATADDRVRFTAPSLVLRRDGESVVAGGWQPLLAYDVLLANFDPDLERVAPPESPEPVLDFFRDGLTTAEVALLLADGPDPVPDLEVAELLLGRLVEEGKARREPAGAGSLWSAARAAVGSDASRAQV